GAFKLTRPTPQGDDAIVHFSVQGDVIGAFIMTHSNPIYPVTVTAMGPSRFLMLPREVYLERWKHEPELIFRIQNLLSVRMTQLQNHSALAKCSLAAKIAFLLVDLLHRQEKSDDPTLPLPLTRKEVAETLGATVESVIRVMSE